MRAFTRFSAIIIFLGIFFISSGAQGAAPRNLPVQPEANKPQARKAPEKPAAISGQNIKNEYFSITLPADWIMVYPLAKKQDGVSAVFTNNKSQVTVTLNVIKRPLTTKQFADLVIPGMRQSGLNPSQPKNTGDLCNIKLDGQAKGEAWFSANGQIAIATVILAPTPDIRSANNFLKALQSPERKMFPAEIK